MQRQLSIFDTLQPLDTAKLELNPGDWVKLRRKTVSVAYWKKGEVVQIESVHPVNGSGRFWNERSESWAYLHPDDVTVTLPPIGSLCKSAIATVTELEPAPVVTELAPATVATESEDSPDNIHSVTDCAIVLVTELTPLPVVTELAPATVVTELEPATEPAHSVTGPVSTYCPRGTARRGEYFRFSYRAGAKVKHVHIPGGNTGNSLAQQRAAEVMELSAAGVPSLEIVEHIKRWSRRRHLET